MQKYDIRRGRDLQGAQLRTLAQEVFGEASEDQGKVVASYGALAKLTTWFDGKSLCVETQMRPDVPNDVASETIKRYNAFLEQATGYTAKERGNRAREKAKKGQA